MSTEEKVTRKLRAILSADVKGYSLLMADDEAYTVRKLEEYRTRMSNLIKANSGRVVDSVGDNLLAEFSSAVDAVNCAVDIQKALCQVGVQHQQTLPAPSSLISAKRGDDLQLLFLHSLFQHLLSDTCW